MPLIGGAALRSMDIFAANRWLRGMFWWSGGRERRHDRRRSRWIFSCFGSWCARRSREGDVFVDPVFCEKAKRLDLWLEDAPIFCAERTKGYITAAITRYQSSTFTSLTHISSFVFKLSMSDIFLSEIDEIENDLNQSIDSTTFGIPENSQTKAVETPKSPIISSSVETNQTNFLSAKESFDSLDSTSPPEETTASSSPFASPTKSTISLFGTDVLSFLSPAKEDTNMPKTVAKGTITMSKTTEEEPHFDAATQ